MSGKMCQTASYLWSTKDILGQGATSGVYRGRHRKTGEMVAVKMFNKASYMRPREVQERELEMMLKLKHQNVVRLLAIEQEMSTRNDVIVMELCAGGSLYNVLEKPENYYGLEESEYLRFLRDFIAGIKHLRGLAIIHRDLKPGNIMRAVNEDGSYTYKLTDFGAARELLPDENFHSIYGTEEYLPPEMYEYAVMRVNRQQKFDSTVDLWSIGVTMYHAATGSLPFRPFGGRSNKETMHAIISKKQYGVISGIQRKEGGEIEWSKKLPQTVQISPSIAAELEEVLKDVLENDKSRTMSFDLFIRVCEAIVSKRCIHVFSMSNSMTNRIYISTTATFQEFCTRVEMHTGVPVNEQEFFFNYSPLKGTDYPSVSAFPETEAENPLILFGGQFLRSTALKCLYLPNIPSSSVSSHVDLTADDHMAKSFLALCHQLKRVTQQIYQICRLIAVSCETISRQIQHKWLMLEQQSELVSAKCKAVQVKYDSLLERHDTELRMLRVMFSRISHDISVDERHLTETANSKKLQRRRLDECYQHSGPEREGSPRMLCESWKEGYLPHFRGLDKCDARVDHLLKGVGEIREMFHKERRQGRISFHDEHSHTFEKTRLQEMCRHMRTKASDCIRIRGFLHDQLATWARRVSSHRLHVSQMHKDQDAKLAAFEKLEKELTDWQDMFERSTKKLVAIAESKTSEEDSEKSLYASTSLMSELASSIKELKRVQRNNYQELSVQASLLKDLDESTLRVESIKETEETTMKTVTAVDEI
ncbi:serine/threonine-protein kinase TBK1-like [Corticium candelabrum]|uniref:serine/threonine-protein kinase TBK1-like n=1 Tax=Corticium candelabrum TaxID=121492 RepID=UPI002E26D0EA|nr:serine/threonine-protein kinase TBK1-like [Corticium candelabrum]